MLARHNRAKKDPLKSILKKEEDNTVQNDEDEYSEDSEVAEDFRDGRTIFSDETNMKGTNAKAKLGDIRVKYT